MLQQVYRYANTRRTDERTNTGTDLGGVLGGLQGCMSCLHNSTSIRMDIFMDSKQTRLREETIPVFQPRAKVKRFVDPNAPIRDDKKNGWKWYYTRRQYLMYNPWCAKCGNLGEEVHHVYPRHSHPHLIYKWNNLMTLCKECHAKEHRGNEGDHTLSP